MKTTWIFFAFLIIFDATSFSFPFRLSNPLSVSYTATNTAQTPIRVYKPGGPLEGIFYSDFVHVKFQGKDLQQRSYYPSMDLEFLPELPRVSERAFVLLNPGESVTNTFDLSSHFDFTRVGTYHVEIHPSKQFEIQDLFDSGRLIIEKCKDPRRKQFLYEICGIVEDEARIQEEFQRDFIAMPKSPIELPSSLTLNPPKEQIAAKVAENGSKDVPLFGTLSSASLVIEITSKNRPDKPNIATDFSLSYCEEEYSRREDGIDDYYYLRERYMKEFEERECPDFSIWKYRKAFDDICRRIRNDIEAIVDLIEMLLNPFIELFNEYFGESFQLDFVDESDSIIDDSI